MTSIMHSQPKGLPRRLLAAGLALLVLALTLLATAPGLHAALHSDCNEPHDDNACAITMFAQTADLVDNPATIAAPLPAAPEPVLPSQEALPGTPPYQHRPSHGPPAA